METKTEVKQVSLWRAEGDDCYPVIYVNASIEGNTCEYHSRWKGATPSAYTGSTMARYRKDIEQSVTDCLTRWGKSAPGSTGRSRLGYDKTDFHVVFDNGCTYEGRFDLEYGGLDDGQTFFESLRHRMKWYANESYPEWASYTKDEWESYIKKMRNTLETWN